MGFMDKLKSKVDGVKRNNSIKKQIINEKSISKDDVDFFIEKNGKTPEEYYIKKINSKEYYFRPTWTQEKVEVNSARKQFRLKGTVYNGEDIQRVDFSFEEGTRTKTVKTDDVEVKTKSKFGLGRAALGGAVLGPAGILLGCTKRDKVITKNKNGTSTITIPTLTGTITVSLNDGKKVAIVLPTTDQDKCDVLYKSADTIIEHLNEIKENEQTEPRCFEESDEFNDFKIEVIN